MRQLKIALSAFSVAVLFLITTHVYIEKYLHIPLTVPLASMVPAFVMLIFLREKSQKVIIKVDYEVILFFIGLFVVVGEFEKTGAIKIFSGIITNLFENNHMGFVSSLIWSPGISAV